MTSILIRVGQSASSFITQQNPKTETFHDNCTIKCTGHYLYFIAFYFSRLPECDAKKSFISARPLAANATVVK